MLNPTYKWYILIYTRSFSSLKKASKDWVVWSNRSTIYLHQSTAEIEMLPGSGGTMGFQDLHEETEQNEKAHTRSQAFHTKPRNWEGATEPTSSHFLLNLPHLLKTQKFQNPTYSRICLLQKTNSLKPLLRWSFLTLYGFLWILLTRNIITVYVHQPYRCK